MTHNGQAGEHFRAADCAAGFAEAPAPSGRTFGDVLDEILADMDAGKPLIDVRPTGVAIIDATTGGLVAGEYLAITAGPGVGKSLLADRLALGVLEHDSTATAICFNLETATRVRVARLLCGAAVRINEHGGVARCVPLGDVRDGTLDEDSKQRARETADGLRERIGRGRLTFIDDVADADEIAKRIRAEAPTVAIIDHFGLVHVADFRGSATEQFDCGLRTVAAALRETGTAGILINEITLQSMRDGQGGIGAGRGSAKFPSLAGQVLTLERDDDAGDTITLRLMKNRHGQAMVRQAATLFGGLGYIGFAGDVEKFEKQKPGRVRTRKQAEGDD